MSMGASSHILKFCVSGKRFSEKYSAYFCFNFCITPLPSETPIWALILIAVVFKEDGLCERAVTFIM